MKKIIIKVVGKVNDDYIQDFIKTVIDVRTIQNKFNGKFKTNNFVIKVK